MKIKTCFFEKQVKLLWALKQTAPRDTETATSVFTTLPGLRDGGK